MATTTVYIDGKPVRLDPARVIGKGGEADIYEVSGGSAVKLFKSPGHPDYVGMPGEQKAARQRIATHQTKLKDFPTGLPSNVVVPQALALDKNGAVVGYKMPMVAGAEVLMRYADRTFRLSTDPNDLFPIFADLHASVSALHARKIVIGDFNDLNVLVNHLHKAAYLIDADSFQFGKYPCQTFTAKFVDPLLCDPKAVAPLLVKPHNRDSDWYAFAVMLMQCLLFVDPYGGVYKPKDQAKRMPHTARPLHRVTVFDPEVVYPRPAVPLRCLSDELGDLFLKVFTKDQRGDFPVEWLRRERWTTCSVCGLAHLRAVCPNCQTTGAAVVKEVTVVHGAVTATRVFKTDGLIVCAASLNGTMRWLAYHNGEFRRENGSLVMTGHHEPGWRYRLTSRKTIIAKAGKAIVLDAAYVPETIALDSYQGYPIVDANSEHYFWTEAGALKRDDRFGPRVIGSVLQNQTLFWVGPEFGVGFYRAAELSVSFLMSLDGPAIRDDMNPAPVLRGQLVDATCVFGSGQAWLFTASQEQGHRVHRCSVIDAKTNAVIASAEAEEGDGSWLGTLRGKAAAGKSLFAATDDGVCRFDVDAGRIVEVQRFDGTERFVDSGSQLFVGSDGLYVVGDREVHRLQFRAAP